MVNGMRIAAVLLWLLPWYAATASGLALQVQRTEVELGQGIDAQLHYTDQLPRPALSAVRTALAGDFAVDAGDIEQVGTHAFVQRLTLYPRRAGELTVPALRAGDQHTAPVAIHVAPAQEAGQPLRVRSSVSTTKPWVRQQVRVVMEVASADPFFGLDVHAPELPGFEVIAIPLQQRKETIHGIPYTVKTLGWLLYPLRDGTHTLALPPLSYVRNGLAVRRFYPPRLTLYVKPLPPYVPPLLPVGTISAHTELSPAGTLRSGRLAYWSVDIEGAGVPADWLPPVLAQVTSGRDLQVFPAVTTRRNRPDAAGVHGLVRHRIPLKPLASGRVPLPRLRLQYFDPDSGRIVNRVVTPARPVALSLPVLVLLTLLAATLLGLLIRLLQRFGTARWRRYRLRRQALTQLHSAADPPAVRAALRLFADAEGWPANLSLSAWLDCWRRRYAVPPALSDALTDLGAGCYGSRALAPGLKRRLLGCLHRPSK